MTVQQSGLDDRNLGESIEILHQAVNKLNSVSTNVLNFNKLENTKLKLSAIDIHKLIDEIKEVSIYANASFNHTITLDIDSNISSILCHRSTFMQLITNLVDNSAKYTPENGLISISFTLRLSELTISVTDNGIGIPKKFHEKIFMKFYQVNDDERGCGLGLSFCQDVAKKHAGYISVESPVFPQEQIRRGSKFIIHLPATMAKLNSKLHESSRHLHKNLHLAIRSPALRK